MIGKFYNEFQVQCDICEETVEGNFETWQEAKDFEDAEGPIILCEECR